MMQLEFINAAEVSTLKGRPGVIYILDVAPWTLYRWNGTTLVEVGEGVGGLSSLTDVTTAANAASAAEKADFRVATGTANGTPSAFTSRALTDADDGDVLVCASSQTATVNTGLVAGFGCSFKGAVTFAGTASVTDLRKSGETVIWCSLIQTGTDTYDVVGGKA